LPAWNGLVSKPNDCFMAWKDMKLTYTNNMTPGKTIMFLAEEQSDLNDYNFTVKQNKENEIQAWEGQVCFFTKAALQKTVQEPTTPVANDRKAKFQI
jgi:hypothetical protein